MISSASEPAPGRLQHPGAGRTEPESRSKPDPSKLVQTGITVPNILDSIGRTNIIDSRG